MAVRHSARAASACPWPAAIMSGVVPALSAASTSAPAEISRGTAATACHPTRSCSGVAPGSGSGSGWGWGWGWGPG